MNAWKTAAALLAGVAIVVLLVGLYVLLFVLSARHTGAH